MCGVFDVIVACDGESAWKLAQSRQFDVLVTDQEMPALTGVELCRRVRKHAGYEETPIIMVTAREVDLDIKKLQQELGVDAVLAKPYSPSHLIKIIEQSLAATT